ncbi:MAG: exo-alpha-sialidase, partial [Clostridia bacterium]|nr:exo-alpha-sialidase [Clostridia bacterium]
MQIQTLFRGEGDDRARIPSTVIAPDGRVYAFANLRVATDRDDAAETGLMVSVRSPEGIWSPARIAARHDGWSYMIGSAVADETTGKVMCLFKKIAAVDHEFHKAYSPEERRALARKKEERDGMEEGDYVLETSDGVDFTERKISILPNPAVTAGFILGSAGFSHGSGAGVTLKYGEHRGRLLIPARFSLHPVDDWKDLRTGSSNTVIWSDDHGLSFQTGGIVEPGTGEGTLAELPDGRIYFNSRAYFGDGFRRSAWSADGGESFTGQRAARDLIEPCCNAAVVS